MGLHGGGFCFLAGQERVKKEQTSSYDDAAVGHIEVGPMVAEDVDLDEVDDGAVADAVVEIADGAAEDESKRDGGEAETTAEANECDEDSELGDGGEGDESSANGVG